jgi:hypothetical protein
LNVDVQLLLFQRYFSINETAAPKIILSPTTFAKDIVEAEIKRAITETNVIRI